ncbi:unnamed protein product [Caenorhabditis angaria]|uniref:Tyrosyl-DNA phosphodiesterase n=1 Tax=Caenorhabditis angaria TaxID=860376 RepID=A0A9P1IPB5_9PELO|nr:unnamed protein product [Caenorhabditis angaria]
MKRALQEENSSTNEKKSKFSGWEQAKLYFTPIGGISIPLVTSENALSFENICEIIRPERSVHFNFMIDFDWLISCYPPSLRKNPITLIVGDSDAGSLRRSAKSYENVNVIAAPLPIPFGTHHSKLSIFENSTNIHVIISTANLITGDWEFKTQQFYHACGEISKERKEESPDFFKEDLLEYLSYYPKSLDPWREIIRSSDFSNISDRLIFSAPGYHKNIGKLGHPRLKRLIESSIIPKPSTAQNSRPLYIAQCSSIGSLGKFPVSWLRGEFLKSLEGSSPAPSTSPARLYLIYPTVENVRESCEGYEAGCSLPYRNETHKKQEWLGSLFCKWRSENAKRSKAMPHCKSYVKLVDGEIEWQVVTSANLSKAAWGEFQKNNTQLCIRSYEIGVLITNPNRCQLPYDYPIVKYQKSDKPWTTDEKHEESDVFGKKWVGQ